VRGGIEENGDSALFLEEKIGRCPHFPQLLSAVRKRRGDNMKNSIKLFDVVALTVDLPEHNLWHGQVGTVVEILAKGNAFEVEFSDSDGRTYASLGLRPDQIMILHYKSLPARKLVFA